MQGKLLDDFEDISGWTAVTSGQAQLAISRTDGPSGKAMRLEFDFRGGGGFVVARKLFPLALPDKPAGKPVCSPHPWGSPSGPCSARPNPLPADLCTAKPPAGGSAGIALPESYSFGFFIRGNAPDNIFEFKLVDASGQNVWRYRVEEFHFPEDWRPVRIRNSQIEFAWGPLGGGPACGIAAIELVIAAGPGGKGTVELADLSFRDDTYRATPVVIASSALPGFEPEQMGGSGPLAVIRRVVAAGGPLPLMGAGWRSADDAPQWLEIDFRQEREYGGLVIEWEQGMGARDFDVQVSTDGAAWKTAYATTQGGGERSYVYLPHTLSRYLRLNLNRSVTGRGFGIRDIEIKPFDFSRSINTFFESIAKEWPAGFYPKYLLGRHKSAGSGFGRAEHGPKGEPQGRALALPRRAGAQERAPRSCGRSRMRSPARGEQTYWTLVGTGTSGSQALFNEEGMVEVDKGSFSIEPFLYAGRRLLTWADVALTQGLEQGYLPIPWSEWRADGLVLKITAFAASSDPQSGQVGPALAGSGGLKPALPSGKSTFATPSKGEGEKSDPALYIRYRLENTGTERQPVRLFAAIRPFQVTPTWQHWRAFGGVAEVRELAFRDGAVRVNGDKAVISLTPAAGFGAAAFAEGAVTEYLASGELPLLTEVTDEFGYGSGALRFDLDLAPGAAEDIYLAVPFGAVAGGPIEPGWRAVAGPEPLQQAVRTWEATLNTTAIRLPAAAQDLADTFKTAAAHILINRDGPALHPGPRRYNRAWLRDGVLMGAALLRVGCTEALRDFLRWYAQFQTEDGNLPDCADREGTEWLPEFDAYGQFIYGVMEYWRFTGDRSFVREMQPAVWKTLSYLENLRARRLTPEYQTPEKRPCYGLLPESMSHEGYMAHPVHAYWDDFWALRGLKDAVAMAETLGDTAEAARLKALRDEFCRDLYASLDAAIARHGIDFVPGCVEFGDFDPAATAIALAPVDETHRLPRPEIDRTFDRYLAGFRDRASGAVAWNNYSAYEIRIVGALVRLGRRQDALELTQYLLADRRIRSWNQWPEISWRDPLGPSFLGDLPHTWISGEYILAVRSLFAYEREADESLVIAAGIAAEWLSDGCEVAVENLPTWYGKLSYSLRLESAGTLRLILDGDLAVPPGGIVVQPPLPRPIVRVESNGGAWVDSGAESFRIRAVPAEVVVKF